MQQQKACHVRSEEVHSEKWLRLTKLYYRDELGVERQWDCCERTTRRGDCDGVEILARIKHGDDREDDMVLCIQYRPPMKAYCVEFPAGLIDENETAEDAAIRELREECGYSGAVVSCSPLLGMEVGLSNANSKLVTIEVDASENSDPKQSLDDGEQIQVVTVPISQLMSTLVTYAQQDGYIVDAKLWMLAQGLQLAAAINKK